MNYIDRHLLDDEQIVFRTKKHFIIFAAPVFWTALTLFCYFSNNPILNNVAFAPAIAALLTWAYQFLNYITSDFAVTNKRVFMKEGFFFRHSNELRLSTISNISSGQSLLGQILNYGNLVIHPFGGNQDIFTAIASPLQFEKTVQIQLDKIEKRFS